MLVSINLLTYNGQNFIKDCLDSVFNQTFYYQPNIELLIIDNASSDNTRNEIKKYFELNPKSHTLIINKKNLGFAAGHNQGIRKSRGKYILCLNQDVVLDKDFLKWAIGTLEIDEKIGAIQGKLLRQRKHNNNQRTIDTTGLIILKNRRVINRGQGERDQGQYDLGEEVFGADGAAPVYRRAALEDIKIKDEYFDEDFFCYKEDVDLAWRMRLSGWRTIYVPEALAWHPRGSGDSAALNPIDILKERRKINSLAKYFSFKNQRLMQIKNEDLSLILKHFPHLLGKEIGALGYVLLFEKYGFKAIWQFLREAPRAFRKRKIIMKKRRVGAREMEKWFK